MGLRDIIQELAFSMTGFQRLLVKEISEVDLWFVIGVSPLPEKFPGDPEDCNQYDVEDSTLSRRWVLEVLDNLDRKSVV